MSGRRLRIATLGVLTAAVVACGSESPSPSPAASGSGAEPDGSAGPIASGAAPAPSFDGDLPAGIQFDPSQSLPAGFGGLFAEYGGELQFFGMQSGGPSRATWNGSAWETSAINPGVGYAPPPGYVFQGGASLFRPSHAAAGPEGTVVSGSALATSQSQPGAPAVPLAILWFSADGSSWRQFDPRDILSGGAATSVLIADVAVTDDGFVVVGSAGPASSAQPPAAVIITSPDGVTWTVSGSFGSGWGMAAREVFPGAGRLLVAGAEYPCVATANAPLGGSSGSLRLWMSDDAGGTWHEIDSAGADPVLHTPEPPPSSAATCPAASDYVALQARFETSGEVLGLADDRVVALSEDGTRTAATDELTAWTMAEVPNAMAAAGDAGEGPRDSAATLLTADSSAWTLRQVRPRRDGNDAELGTGCQVFWWQSTDAGAHWYAGPLARPLRVCEGGFYSLHALSDGSVAYVLGAVQVTTNPISAYALSESGPPQDWTTCTPAAGAACAFALITAPAGSNLDWSGIDLFGATVTDAQLDGVNLVSANLVGVTLDGGYRGANVSGTFLADATLGGDFSGANFSGAFLENMTFAPGTTCPDGQPATTAAGGVACRL